MQPKKVFIGKIPCVIWTPDDYVATKVYPWVVAFHGQGEIGDGSDAQLTSKIINSSNFANLLLYAEKYDIIVVMPQLVLSLNNWIPGFTADYINQAINYAQSHYPVDINKMYLTGLSLGGGAVWQYITSSIENANRVAAAIPVCGVPIVGGDWSLVAASNIPIWAFHAADDGTVGVAATRNQIAAVNKYNPQPEAKYTEYTTGNHYIWGRVYGDESIYKWMLQQVNNNVVTPPLPIPEPFKPNSRIIRADGSVEHVRIESIL